MSNNKFLKNKKIKELKLELNNLLKEKFNLKIYKLSGNLKKTHLIKLCKKKIAKLRTFLCNFLKEK